MHLRRPLRNDGLKSDADDMVVVVVVVGVGRYYCLGICCESILIAACGWCRCRLICESASESVAAGARGSRG